ncbi:MAG: ornithine carbamoyltransferase [SAR86 cluster bacterium]|jgi:ornithine carbamoyltransferase|nr:ornithine carbamoyltransferase [SAR86 cluster bacterium]
MNKHFLNLKEYGSTAVVDLVYGALELKKGSQQKNLNGKYLALIFEKSSTRTRLSFEVAMNQLGGRASFLSVSDLQLGRGEPISDTAKVISSMADGVVLRTLKHSTLEAFAESSTSPIINGLTNLSHPCQLLADMLTFIEHKGSLENKKVCWVGDFNNVCYSYMEAAEIFNFNLTIVCPDEYKPKDIVLNSNVELTSSIDSGLKEADLVTTDVWVSMGDEKDSERRLSSFSNYQISPAVMDKAKNDSLFLHCLPAIRGQEISADMLDDPRSKVWEQAENRLHAQKSLLLALL